MDNKVKVVVPDFGIKADDMTHGLKMHGNGSMLEGIRNMCIDAYKEGEKMGLKNGIAYGVVGTVSVALLYKGGKMLCHKIKLLNRGNLNDNMPQNGKTEGQFKQIQQDKEFSWTKVKWSMHLKDYFDISDFEDRIRPLECKVYKDRIFLESPSALEDDILYLKKKYKDLVEKYILETVGKKYVVTFVRCGEITIED